MNGYFWSNENEDRLRALWNDGLSARAIATEMGVSKNAIIDKAHRLGLSGASRPGKPRAEIAREQKRLEAQARRSDAGAKAKPKLARQVPCRPAIEDDRGEAPAPRVVGLTLDQLELTTCRWPIGDPKDEAFRYCGAQGADLAENRPYCRAHARLAYQPSRRPAAHSRPERR